jgi:DNA-binding response OmpR family regulator
MDKHRILVVDDDSTILNQLKEAFETLSYDVVAARNGQEALELCVKTVPSLIISAWQMPILSGVDLFFHMKNAPTLEQIPFVLITNLGDEDTKVALLERGLEDYWNKPLNIKEVIAKTKKILARVAFSQQFVLPANNKSKRDSASRRERTPVVNPVINLSDLDLPTNPSSQANLFNNNYDEPSETYLYVNRVLNNRYKLMRPIGRGGMGIIYQAQDLVDGREFALKLLRREYSSNNVEVSRFWREATTALQVKHPNVIEIYEYGTTSSGQVFITMEILTGHSLMTELTRGRTVSSNHAIKIMEQVCLGMLAVHKQGIIHRDLKPSNIFLLDKPLNGAILKILDFGIAFLQPKTEMKSLYSERLTDPNMIVGTPEYMSPEQIRKQELNRGSDIYSLGIVFYEILTGELPFLGDPIEILFAQVNKEPVPINQIISIDIELANIIMSMLAKDPKLRPSLESIISTLKKYSNLPTL